MYDTKVKTFEQNSGYIDVIIFVAAYEGRKLTRKFSEETANELLLDIYLPRLNKWKKV